METGNPVDERGVQPAAQDGCALLDDKLFSVEWAMAGAVNKGHGEKTGAEAPVFMHLCDRQTRCYWQIRKNG